MLQSKPPNNVNECQICTLDRSGQSVNEVSLTTSYPINFLKKADAF